MLKRLCAFVSLVVVIACGGCKGTPAAPSQTLPQSFSLSGTVAENGQPIAKVSVNAWIETANGGGHSYWSGHGPTYTDASGGYRMTSLERGEHVWIQLRKDGYVQQCAASAIISGDLTIDVALMSTAHVTASSMPSAPGLRSVSGTVAELTATGSQPVAGAQVIFGGSPGFGPDELPFAYTSSDTTGRFALCGLPANDTITLEGLDGSAERSGYLSVVPGQTSDVQITLSSTTTTKSTSRGFQSPLER
jgi:hypothetical protein